MSRHNRFGGSTDIQRRNLLKAFTASAGLAALNFTPGTARASQNRSPAVLSGNVFDLEISEVPVNFSGRPAMATAINGSVPGPVLHWREGDTVTLRVKNSLSVPTSIHWHGIVLPTDMDGVPGISFPGIAPGQTFTYRFKVRQSGTFWYHSHTGFQEQTGLYGAIVVSPKEEDPVKADRDYVVQLSDWTDEDPDDIYFHLKAGEGYYNYQKRTVRDFWNDASAKGLAATLKNRWAWGMMRMSPRDISDVTGAMIGGTYTYLVNGKPPSANWTGLFKRGEKVRLRFVNSSAMSYFDVRIPGAKMTVVAADGCNVQPVTVDEFRIGVAETYDVLVQPENEAHTIFAQSLDRSGYAVGTLAVREGLKAEIPPMDPIFTRTMTDMGMGGMGGMHDMHKMQSMHGDHAMHGMKPGNMAAKPNATGQVAWPQPGDVHIERGPAVVNIAMMPTERLDKPGDGLNNNGRRVLTYADLVRLDGGPQNDPFVTRDHDAEVLLHLTGNMERYIFGINGQTYDESQPVRFPYGQRIRVTLINDTMMEHPIHLHGMFQELDNHHGRLRPLKHTVSVKPGEKLHYFVNATELGRWAYHCHLLYHMEAGMFTSAVVA